MDTAIDLSDASKALDLANIRFQLIRLEDTIIFHLIERVQFPLNAAIYDPAALPIPNSNLSLTDYLLSEQERLHSRVRRYQAPDEYPFFPGCLEKPILQPLAYPKILHENDVSGAGGRRPVQHWNRFRGSVWPKDAGRTIIRRGNLPVR